jgi:hypothetical protein
MGLRIHFDRPAGKPSASNNGDKLDFNDCFESCHTRTGLRFEQYFDYACCELSDPDLSDRARTGGKR